MRRMMPREFEGLMSEYRQATRREDRMIRLKLNEIVAAYAECTAQESEFADAITKRFCELIAILKEQHEDERKTLVDEMGYASSDRHRFMAGSAYQAYHRDERRFESSVQLLEAFYEHFIGEKSASTMKDYVARIKTYADRYLMDNEKLWNMYLHEQDERLMDRVLFTYEYVEVIIANFDTKGEDGLAIKQRNNIRSALRKLNDFKRAIEKQP